MERDRNLLFGILAVQIKGVTPKQIVEAGAAWAINTAQPLSAQLVQQGALTTADVAIIDQIVDAAIKAHAGDASKALDMLGGEEGVNRTFHGSLVLRPSGGLDTRPMAYDSMLGTPEAVLSTIEEFPGRYSHISEYGRGGMGRVLLVHDEHMGREVALKELLLPKSEWTGPGDSPVQASAAITGRFLQEARLTGRLEHPAIVPVYELGRRSNGTLYYTMKLVRGKTLSKALKECRGLKERLALLSSFVDICQAIAYAHSRGVIHRDIKPANVMVGAFGETVVLDWGLAKARGIDDIYAKELDSTIRNLRLKVKPKPDATPFETRVGEAVGTPNYMSPEQAEGRIPDINELSDVYSLGVVLFEILAGRVPFDMPSIDGVLWNIVNTPAPGVTSLEPDAPPELVEVCAKAMHKDPAKRYGSAQELAEDVRRFMTGSMVQAYSYSPAQVLSRYYKQHRAMINTVAAAAVALLLLGVYSYVNILQARNSEHAQRLAADDARAAAETARITAEKAKDAEAQARKEAEAQQYVAQLRLAQSYIGDQQMPLANEALDNTPKTERDWTWGYLKNQANQALFMVHSDKSIIFWAKFDPSGKFIVALRNPEPPGMWSATDGALVRDFEGDDSVYNNAGFNEDGSHFAAIGETALDVWDTTTGKRLYRLTHPTMGYDLAFTPGQTRVWGSYEDGQLVEWDLSSGVALRTLDTQSKALGVLRIADGVLLTVANKDGPIQAWDLDTGQRLYTTEGSAFWPSPDGKTFVANKDDIVHLVDTGTGQILRSLNGHRGPLLHAAFSQDGKSILTASRDTNVRFWSSGQETPVTEFGLTNDIPCFAYFLNNGDQILACGRTNRYTVRDTKNGAELYSFSGTNKAVSLAELSPDSAILLSCSALHTFEVFNAILPGTLSSQSIQINDLSSPNGQAPTVASDRLANHIAYAMQSKVFIFDTDANRITCELSAQSNVQSLALSSDGKVLAYSAGNSATAVELSDLKRPITYGGLKGDVLSVVLNANGERAATSDESGEVHVWDSKNATALWKVKLPSAADDLAFFENGAGEWLICGCRDGHVRIYVALTGVLSRDFTTGEAPIFAVVPPYTSQGKLVTVSRNGRIAFWACDDFSPAGFVTMEESYLANKLPGKVAWYTDDDRYLTTSMAGLAYASVVIDTVRQNILLRVPNTSNMILRNNLEAICLTQQGVIQFNNLSWKGL